jgi:two-component system chemotaxis response regulator CheY
MNKKIMIVDDSQAERDNTKNILSKDYKFDFIEAADGVQAWEIIQKDSSIDLFILDYLMPALNGLELTEKIRGLDCYKKHPIFLFTSDSKLEVMQKGRELNAIWVGKPMNVKVFPQVINELTKVRK